MDKSIGSEKKLVLEKLKAGRPNIRIMSCRLQSGMTLRFAEECSNHTNA